MRTSLPHGLRGSEVSPMALSITMEGPGTFCLRSVLCSSNTGYFLPQNDFLHLTLLSLTAPLSIFNSQLRWHFLDNSFPKSPEVCTSPHCSSSHIYWYSFTHKDRGHIVPTSLLYPQAEGGVQGYNAQQQGLTWREHNFHMRIKTTRATERLTCDNSHTSPVLR